MFEPPVPFPLRQEDIRETCALCQAPAKTHERNLESLIEKPKSGARLRESMQQTIAYFAELDRRQS